MAICYIGGMKTPLKCCHIAIFAYMMLMNLFWFAIIILPWAGRKTRVHIMTGGTPVFFLLGGICENLVFLLGFIREHLQFFFRFDTVKVYYDNGQTEVNKIH